MLRALNPPEDRDRREPYRMPWSVDRIFDTHPLVTNAGAAPVDFVRVLTWSPEVGVSTEHWGQMLPGESVELCLCASDVAQATVTLAWFRQDDGMEYLWRFTM
jgi:hypothetical protein